MELNKASIEEGVLTVTIQLEGKPAAFAEAIGSLVLAQDIVRTYFQQKAMANMMKAKTTGIIKPGMAN